MNKFWTAVAVIVIVGLGLVMIPDSRGKSINFTDLETECRYDRGSETTITLNPDNSLSFEGHFPVESPEAEVDYSYSQGSGSVTLDVYSDDTERPGNFFGTCLASGIYDSKTRPLQEGRYFVTVKHDGETVEEKVIRVE